MGQNYGKYHEDIKINTCECLHKGKVQKKNIKKLTNVILYVCMSAENSKMLVFFMFFSPTVVWKITFKIEVLNHIGLYLGYKVLVNVSICMYV